MNPASVLVYYAWSRPAECDAPLGVLEDRFPALFEVRRGFYPRYAALTDPERFDQGIRGFLDHVQRPNFEGFVRLATDLGHGVREVERVDDRDRRETLDALLDDVGTLIVISFDSLRTAIEPTSVEVDALRRFVDTPGRLAFVCPHHDIGADDDRQLADFRHHGDPMIPPRQGFGGFARALLRELGVPVVNRYGLRPAVEADGSPSPADIDRSVDRLGLMTGVTTLNRHAHLPHLERIGDAYHRMEVLTRQRIDRSAPPHPFADAHASFDAVLQSRADTFAGTLLVSDTTLFSSTVGGLESLQRLWTNVLERSPR